MEKTEEADCFAKEGDLGGPQDRSSVVGPAVGFCVVHGLAKEMVQAFI